MSISGTSTGLRVRGEAGKSVAFGALREERIFCPLESLTKSVVQAQRV